MFQWLKKLVEKRASLKDGRDTWLHNSLAAAPTKSGVTINEKTALNFSAVYSAVRLLSESLASLPLQLFKRTPDDDREADRSGPLFFKLHDAPNEEMTSYTWREMMMGYTLLWGNGVSQIVRERGVMKALWPIEPWRVSLRRTGPNKRLVYVVDDGALVIEQEDVIHISSFGTDSSGWGLSPIQLARESIGLAMGAEQFGSSFFGNSTRPSGILEYPHVLDPERKKELGDEWKALNSGVDSTGKTIVLEHGMQWKQMGIPPEDAQFLQTRQFQIAEVARWYRVPPHMIADLERATFSNVAEQQRSFYVDSLRAWLVRWEQELNRKLLGPAASRRRFYEFNADALLRGDTRERYETYRIAHDTGLMTKNEIRKNENLNSLGPDGDIIMQTMNLAPLGAEEPEPEPIEEDTDDTSEEGEEEQKAASADLIGGLGVLMRDAFGRLTRVDTCEIRRQISKRLEKSGDLAGFSDFVGEWYGTTFRAVVDRTLRPIIEAMSPDNVDAALENMASALCMRCDCDALDVINECGSPEVAAVSLRKLCETKTKRSDEFADIEAEAIIKALNGKDKTWKSDVSLSGPPSNGAQTTGTAMVTETAGRL